MTLYYYTNKLANLLSDNCQLLTIVNLCYTSYFYILSIFSFYTGKSEVNVGVGSFHSMDGWPTVSLFYFSCHLIHNSTVLLEPVKLTVHSILERVILYV